VPGLARYLAVSSPRAKDTAYREGVKPQLTAYSDIK
jgi:hypothetical protein